MLFKVCILKASYDDFNTCFSKSIIFTLQPDEIQHIQIPQKYSSSSFSFQQKLSKRFPFSPKRILLKLMSIPHILHFHCPSAKYCDNIESPQNFIQSLDFNNASSKSKKDIQRKLVCYPWCWCLDCDSIMMVHLDITTFCKWSLLLSLDSHFPHFPPVNFQQNF